MEKARNVGKEKKGNGQNERGRNENNSSPQRKLRLTVPAICNLKQGTSLPISNCVPQKVNPKPITGIATEEGYSNKILQEKVRKMLGSLYLFVTMYVWIIYICAYYR